MKLVVLGGTGRTGKQLLQQALENGHDLVALCRNPAKLTLEHERLKVVQADVMSIESLKPHFADCDAVLSCLGTDGGIIYSTTFYSDSIKSITAAMREAQVSCLICMTSWFTSYRKSDGGSFFIEWILKPIMGLMIGRILSDMAVMEKYVLEECQDMNFTIVRPPGLSDGPVSDKKISIEEGRQYVAASTGNMMPRADVARFMLSTLNTSEFDKKVVAISV